MPASSVWEKLPLPSLRQYVGISALFFSCVFYYAYRTVASDVDWQVQFELKMDHLGVSDLTRQWLDRSVGARSVYFMMTDQICIWGLVNTGCCVLLIIGRLIQCVVFGKLRLLEQTRLKGHFMTFIFFKFVFIFGILNLQYLDEVVLWCVWCSVIGFLTILSLLAHDRFTYVSSSPTNAAMMNLKIVALLSCVLLASCALFVIAAVASVSLGINFGTFLAADCMLTFFRAGYGIFKYSTSLGTFGADGLWNNKSTLIYYVDLVFDLLIMFTELLNYIHMVAWNSATLSLATFVLLFHMKFLYAEIDKRLRNHRNHQRVLQYIDQNYPHASRVDLEQNNDNCAICWDKMDCARRLPCGHLFHDGCLRGWLEQDHSCPTCRCALATPRHAAAAPAAVHRNVLNNLVDIPDLPADAGGGGVGARRRRRTNHVFHFDGTRYARWLPSFSVQVSHTIGDSGASALIFGGSPVSSSQINGMAAQVQEMFPQMAIERIVEDLNETRSIQATIENILENRIFNDLQDESAAVADSGSESSSDGEIESDLTSIVSDSDDPSGHSSQPRFSAGQFEERESSNAGSASPLSSASSSPVMPASAAMMGSANYSFLSSTATCSAYNGSSSCSGILSQPTLSSAGARFSKCSDEREVILDERKRHLIELHRSHRFVPHPLVACKPIKSGQRGFWPRGEIMRVESTNVRSARRYLQSGRGAGDVRVFLLEKAGTPLDKTSDDTSSDLSSRAVNDCADDSLVPSAASSPESTAASSALPTSQPPQSLFAAQDLSRAVASSATSTNI